MRSVLRGSIALVAISMLALLAFLAVQWSGATQQPAPRDGQNEAIAQGKYIAQIGGCNDCHTTGYNESDGTTPEAQWLLGSELGWCGAWGTTYPFNLRLVLARMSADDWVAWARQLKTNPPMPWYDVRAMTEADLRALHAFVQQLGPSGEPAPEALPPGKKPKGPCVQFPTQ